MASFSKRDCKHHPSDRGYNQIVCAEFLKDGTVKENGNLPKTPESGDGTGTSTGDGSILPLDSIPATPVWQPPGNSAIAIDPELPSWVDKEGSFINPMQY